MLGPHSPPSEMAARYELYRHELEAHGHTFAGREVPMTRFIAVATSDREAEEVARRGARWLVDSYVNQSKSPAALAAVTRGRSQGAGVVDPVEAYLDGIIVHGSPPRVIDTLHRLQEEMFLDHLMCAPLSHASFLMFTEKVMPHFQ